MGRWVIAATMRQGDAAKEGGRRHMAEPSGDVLVVPTREGNAEATRMGQGETGQSRWCIWLPWGAETFYGTAEQAIAHIHLRAREQESGVYQIKGAEVGRQPLWAAWRQV
jgi:glycerol-3-phosphate dehydrogenase